MSALAKKAFTAKLVSPLRATFAAPFLDKAVRAREGHFHGVAAFGLRPLPKDSGIVAKGAVSVARPSHSHTLWLAQIHPNA